MANYIQPNTSTVTPSQAAAGVTPVVNGNSLAVPAARVAPFVENVGDYDDPHLVIRGPLLVHKGANNR